MEISYAEQSEGNNQITRLLLLKRYEHPPHGYFDDFLEVLRVRLYSDSEDVDPNVER